MLATGAFLAKIAAVFGLAGAVMFALTDSATAASIAAVGTVAAALIGCLNTWLQTITIRKADENARRLRGIHDTARDSASVVREITGTERRTSERPTRDSD